MFNKIKKYILAHKIISTIVVIIVLFGGYEILVPKTATGQTEYVLGNVQQGVIISSLSESGQVSASDEVDIKAKASTEVTWVGVKPGDTVYAGQAIASLDATQAQQAVDSAKASLATAKLQLEQDTAQAPITFQKNNDQLTTDTNNLQTEYNNAWNTIANTYLDLPAVVTGTEDTLYGYDLSSSKTQANADILVNLFSTADNAEQATVKSYTDTTEAEYTSARPIYDADLATYKTMSITSATSSIDTLLASSITATTGITQTLQSELNLLGTITDVANQYDIKIPSGVTTLETNAKNYLATANSDLNAMLAEQKQLTSDKEAITTDQQNIQLLQVGNPTGATPISLQISQADLATQEQNLATLEQNLSDYTVVAPFAGVISTVTAKLGDTGDSTIATIITKQQIATLSVNELDAAKIALGDKAIMTFDAIDGLSITGTVAQIDSVGTVSQGVVSYNVQITFDTQDARVKPGMTVNADIQTAVHTNALYVPSSAVKTTNGSSYVQVFNPPIANPNPTGVISATPPTQIPVTTGISDDTDIEILSGLTEGEQVVTRTTTTSVVAKAATAAPSATSLLGGSTGGNRTFTGGAGGAGAVRIGG